MNLYSSSVYRKVASSRLSWLVAHFKDFQTAYETGNLMFMYCDLWPKELKVE